MKTLKKIYLFLFFLLGVCVLIWLTPKPSAPHFLINPNQYLSNPTNLKPFFESELIPQPAYLPSAHSATVTVLNDGSLLAQWFAGSHEGRPDVKIWQSRGQSRGLGGRIAWSMATPIVSPEILQQQLQLFVRKVGNPVVYKAQNGRLHLFVVSVAIGGWSGSSLNHFISNDEGKTWVQAQRLILSPFLNISTLDRTSPVPLTDGGFYLPVYHELFHHYPELLQFDANGNFIRQIRMSGNESLLQPALVALSANDAKAFLRNSAKINNILYSQDTHNGGISWSKPAPTDLVNHDSSIVVAKISSTQFLMVHDVDNRDKLALALSENGIVWHDFIYLENSPGLEFSYPAIMVHDGIVDILYTWRRQKIKHVRFNLAWLKIMSEKTFNDTK